MVIVAVVMVVMGLVAEVVVVVLLWMVMEMVVMVVVMVVVDVVTISINTITIHIIHWHSNRRKTLEGCQQISFGGEHSVNLAYVYSALSMLFFIQF